jgi:hypothetical protein
VNRCAYCGKRAYVQLVGADHALTPFDLPVCPQCGPVIAASLRRDSVQLTPYPDHRTVGRAVRIALLWALIIMMMPVVAGMVWAALEMINGR